MENRGKWHLAQAGMSVGVIQPDVLLQVSPYTGIPLIQGAKVDLGPPKPWSHPFPWLLLDLKAN